MTTMLGFLAAACAETCAGQANQCQPEGYREVFEFQHQRSPVVTGVCPSRAWIGSRVRLFLEKFQLKRLTFMFRKCNLSLNGNFRLFARPVVSLALFFEAFDVRGRQLRPVDLERQLVELAGEGERTLVVLVVHRRAGVGADVERFVPLRGWSESCVPSSGWRLPCRPP